MPRRIFLIYPFAHEMGLQTTATQPSGLLSQVFAAHVNHAAQVPDWIQASDWSQNYDREINVTENKKGDPNKVLQQNGIWLPTHITAGQAMPYAWTLSEDLHPNVKRFFNDRSQLQSLSDAALKLACKALVVALPSLAKVRLGLAADSQIYLRVQYEKAHVLQFKQTVAFAIFEVDYQLYQVSNSGDAWQKATGEALRVESIVEPAGAITEVLHQLSAVHRSGALENTYNLVPKKQENEPDLLQQPLAPRLLAQALVGAALGLSEQYSAHTLRPIAQRLFSFTAECVGPDVDLLQHAFRLARRYTRDYSARLPDIEASGWTQFENLAGSAALEGVGLAAIGELQAVQNIVQSVDKHFLPLYLLALQEYSVLSTALDLRHESGVSGSAKQLNKAIALLADFNLSCRMPMVSQVSQHGAFYRAIRLQLGNRELIRDLENDAKSAQLELDRRAATQRAKSTKGISIQIAAFVIVFVSSFHALETFPKFLYEHNIEKAKISAITGVLSNAQLEAAPYLKAHTVEQVKRDKLSEMRDLMNRKFIGEVIAAVIALFAAIAAALWGFAGAKAH